MATFIFPMVLENNANIPKALLSVPIVFELSDWYSFKKQIFYVLKLFKFSIHWLVGLVEFLEMPIIDIKRLISGGGIIISCAISVKGIMSYGSVINPVTGRSRLVII